MRFDFYALSVIRLCAPQSTDCTGSCDAPLKICQMKKWLKILAIKFSRIAGRPMWLASLALINAILGEERWLLVLLLVLRDAIDTVVFTDSEGQNLP